VVSFYQPDFPAVYRGRQLLHQLQQAGPWYHRPAGKMTIEDRVSYIEMEYGPDGTVAGLKVIDDKKVIQQHELPGFRGRK
jgi:hypothetical protein